MNPISIPLTEQKPALAGLGKVISKRTTLPVLGCVKIERTKTGRTEITGTDLDSTAIATLEAHAQGEITALLIPFEDLNNVAKSCGRADTLIIAGVEKNRVAIKFPVGGQFIEHRCESLPVEEFPIVAEVRGEPIPLDDTLRRSIHDALACASTDQTRLILNGAYLDVSKPNAHYVVGTDGRHLFSSNSFALPMKSSLIIPSHRFLGSKEFNDDGDWSLRVGEPTKDHPAAFEIATSHWRFLARSLYGNYPNWRQVVPTPGTSQTTAEIDPQSADALVQTIARLPNHDAINFAVRIEITNRRLSLLAKSTSDDPWRGVEIDDVKVQGKDVAIHVNRHLLTKALRFGLTRLDIIDELSPLRFSHAGRQMIVMPTRPEPAPRPASPTPSPEATPPAAANTNPPPASAEQPETKNTMPEQNGNPNGGASRPAATNPAEKTALDTALAQIEVVRGDFRNAIAGLNKLADALKQAHRESKASDKEISSVRATLRSLQSVRI